MVSVNYRLLESFGLKNGKYIAYPYHFNRLKKSAVFFNFKLQLDVIHEKLTSIKESHPTDLYKIRLLIDQYGEMEWDILKIEPFNKKMLVDLAHKPINKSNIFLYHKTTMREVYDQAKGERPDLFDVLLWNDAGELTEFTVGNFIYEMNGTLYTPPVETGLLAGTFREELLDKGIIKIKTIHKTDLADVSKIWLVNSVREWVALQFISKKTTT